MKVSGRAAKEEMSKRNYWVSGFTLDVDCPDCGSHIKRDLDGDRVNYPVIGESYDYYISCDECDHEFEVPIIFNITAKIGE